jgi:ribose/xylose/arabinose/galactoside ABC-type transport system permease subunit
MTMDAADPGRFARRLTARSIALEYSSWILLVALVIVGATVSPLFFTIGNLIDILYQSSIIGVMAIGQFFVILTGGIDLGVGSVLALSAVVGGLGVSAGGTVVGVAVSLAVCGVFGALTGAVVAFGRMPSFIVTFGALAIARGLALSITSGGPVNLADPVFFSIGNGYWPQIIWATVIVIAYFILARLPVGRHIYATGGNIDSAHISGINTSRTLILVYAISAICAAIGGLIFTARSTVALPTYGQGYELQTIAACVLGGTDLFGGIGKLSGVVLGVIILTMLGNILTLTGVDPFWNFIAIGAALWISVAFRSRLVRRR